MTMNLQTILHGLLFAAALWVGVACVWRLNLLHWSKNDWLTIIAYILIGVWAATYFLALAELQPLGIVGVALLFYTGRRRWLTEPPVETRSAT